MINAQLKLFSIDEKECKQKAVNVSSVKQLSPFRYPGGKTWLIPTLKEWFQLLPKRPSFFVEPFLGGGIVSLTVGHDNLADKIIMSELDSEISAVWKTIIYGNISWLINKILTFNLTTENANFEITTPRYSIEEIAFKTILKNRIYHGGIIAPGAGMLKSGENGKGIKSRWYPETICKRIQLIQKFKHKFEFYEKDAFEIIDNYLLKNNVVFFIDPPYTASKKRAGSRLYRYHEIDHYKLFSIFKSSVNPFIFTYDNSDEIKSLCCEFHYNYKEIPMKNTHNLTQKELIISNYSF